MMRRSAIRVASLLCSKVVTSQEQQGMSQLAKQLLPAFQMQTTASFSSNRSSGVLSSLAQQPLAMQLHAMGQLRRIGCGMNACSADIAKSAPKVYIEYDQVHVDKFIELADHIEDLMPHLIVMGNETDDGEVEARPGSFEIITGDGTSLYSMLSNPSGNIDVDSLVAAIGTKIPDPSEATA